MGKNDGYEYSVADAICSEKLMELYVNAGRCTTATLYRDSDGDIFVFRYWLNTGAGPDHSSQAVSSAKELRKALSEDVKYGFVGKAEAEKVCGECEKFFARK